MSGFMEVGAAAELLSVTADEVMMLVDALDSTGEMRYH